VCVPSPPSPFTLLPVHFPGHARAPDERSLLFSASAVFSDGTVRPNARPPLRATFRKRRLPPVLFQCTTKPRDGANPPTVRDGPPSRPHGVPSSFRITRSTVLVTRGAKSPNGRRVHGVRLFPKSVNFFCESRTKGLFGVLRSCKRTPIVRNAR